MIPKGNKLVSGEDEFLSAVDVLVDLRSQTGELAESALSVAADYGSGKEGVIDFLNGEIANLKAVIRIAQQTLTTVTVE